MKMDLKNITYKFTLFALTFFALVSCSREIDLNNAGRKGVSTLMSVRAKSVLFDSDPDNTITSIRIMAFDRSSQKFLRSNKFYPVEVLEQNITHTIYSGVYDFVVIANEPSGAVHAALEGVTRWSELEAINIPSAVFNSNDNIPMVRIENEVTVLPDNGGVVIGGVTYPTWTVALKRLAVRFDMILKSTINISADFKGVKFSNIPDNVPIVGDYSGSHTQSRSFMIANPDDAKYFRDTIIGGVTWAKVVNRVIMPANSFSPTNQVSRALNLSALVGPSNDIELSGKLGIDINNGDYTLPLNNRFAVNATLQMPLQVNVAAADWGLVNVPGDVYDRKLYVSELTTYITDRNRTRIYFWSNQPKVYVEAQGVNSGGTTFNVNDIFDNIGGTPMKNVVYDPATGVGYIDVMFNLANTTVPQNLLGTYRIYLNASGVRREIKVNLQTGIWPPAWSSGPVVGTFHRWNQVGERIVYGGNSGAWTATIEAGSDFFVISGSRSIDPKLGTTTANDAEQYPVLDGTTTASGNGRVYFRVGMKSTGTSTSNRFGRIRVDWLSGSTPKVSYVYVRQGDTPQAVNGTTKWSVYNLSDPLRGLGGADYTNHSMFTPQAAIQTKSFADYPSNMGYFFKWNTYDGTTTDQRRAFNPTNPAVNVNITGIGSTYASAWVAANDPCPVGYRHPTNAEIVALAPDNTTSIWGYLADGWMDRGFIVGYAVTGSASYQIGYVGRLFYNSTSNASVFLPLTGHRNFSGAWIENTTSGYYMSSDIQPSQNIYLLTFTSSTVNPSYTSYGRTRFFNVRCVAK